MIYLKQHTIQTNQNLEELISKLKWKIHLDNNPYFVRTTNLRNKTNRPFTGKINESDGSFYIKRIRPFFDYYFPVFVVKGEFVNDGEKINLKLRFQLGFISTIFLLYILFGVFLFLREIATSGFEFKGLAWFLLPLLFVILGSTEIEKIKEKLMEILEI